jgi:surface antigen
MARTREPIEAGPCRTAILAALLCLLPGLGQAADDPRDATYLAPVLQDALETARTNVELPWRNPASGNAGSITVERTFYREPGTPCRAYVRTLEEPGEASQVTKGTGCRSSTGLWLIEEEPSVGRAAPAAIPPGPGAPSRAPATVAEEGPSCPDTVLVPMPASRPPTLAYTLPTRAEL